jgi:RNA polymerase sigma-32 factor
MHKIITSHLRFVVYVTKQYSQFRKISMTDLIQEGNIALMKCAKNFDHTLGFRFVTFAVYHVKNAILNFVQNNIKITKFATTKSRIKLCKNYRNISLEESPKQISERLNVPIEDVRDFLAWMVLEENTDDDSINENLIATVDFDSEIYTKKITPKIQQALLTLNEREKEIIFNKFYSETPLTLMQLGEKYGVSFQRIAQLEKQALKKLKEKLQ